ncbi:sel1 repeat family protein [Thalassotalea sp. LPB0316]|uniref:tetratricopeptide repeat protein n=1 Tax=Thalassotalea sp. LPB0316 TaxID=2769490 RepID=UPI001868BB4D|nr:SEL1-like repeat protein [Thalassotalea sp. LPB0316]QOL26581.1 sel1 repeat family protein [Thalassotalea sp. LPB0316]
MLSPRYFIFVIYFILSGCASTSSDSKQENFDKNKNFYQLLNQFKSSPDSVSYDELWFAYLKSDQIENSGIKQDEYHQVTQKLFSGEAKCEDINWEEITQLNFWSIKPHISAQTCYESMGVSDKADFHAASIDFLLTGILSNGDGRNYYSAYEIATWGDASDIVELAGYEIVDSYYELKHFGQALYFIYIVNDPETGFQKEIYFENNKFLHEILDIQYPFASLNNLLQTEVIDFFSQTDTNAKIAKAKILVLEEKYDDAVVLYLDAIQDGSIVANYLLGMLCHSDKQTILLRSECTSFFFQAAEMGYVDASIALAFIYMEGLEVEKSKQLGLQLMSSIEGKLEPGQAWHKLAYFYNDVLGIQDKEKYRYYLNQAAAHGDQEAQATTVLLDIQTVDENDLGKIEAIIQRLKGIAENGLDTAQVSYANFLLTTSQKGSENWNEAKLWLEKSANQGNPLANHLLGNAYQYGYFGEKNLLKAYFAYNDAALNYYPDSQLQIGYFNDIGRVVEEDKQLAISWYFLCAKASNLNCLRNLAVFFQNGIAVEQNYEAALHYYTMAANLGHAQSITDLALMYLFGNGTEQDVEKSNELFKKSCDLKDGKACMNLGNNYVNGEGFSKNIDKANELFDKACQYGFTGGCNNLANSYEQGRGVSKDYGQAAKLYKQACDAGNSMSCSNLGYMYRHGNGMPQNISKAKELYLKACSGGYDIGCSNYRGLLQ